MIVYAQMITLFIALFRGLRKVQLLRETEAFSGQDGRVNGAPCDAASGGRNSRNTVASGAMDGADRSVDAGCVVAEARPLLADPQGRMPGGRVAWGVLSFGDFSLDKQRKVTRSRQRAERCNFAAASGAAA